MPGFDQPGDDVADLSGGHRGLVVIGAQPHHVQHRGVHDVRPGSSAAITEYGQPGIIWACPLARP